MSEFAAPMPVLARYAVMVDVGYIYAAAGELLFGTSARRDYRVDAVGLIQAITKHADELFRGELLRVYWYDAARDRVPTIDQRVVAQMAWVKLRLGNLNARGQQKGVDANIRADMEALARHRAITDAVLIAGDEDMVPAVEAAQAYGVRVHLWGVEPPYGTNQAERLVWESDTVDVLDAASVRPYFARNPAAEAPRADVQATVPSPAQLFGEHRPRPTGEIGRNSHLSRTGPLPHVTQSGAAAAPRSRPPARRGGGRARRPQVDPHPGRRQHPRPAARPDPAARHRQGTARRGGEGARPVAAALPGGQGVAAGRVLGAGAPRVRNWRRQVAWLTDRVKPREMCRSCG